MVRFCLLTTTGMDLSRVDLGVKLNEKFNTKEKVAELIDGGDMSTCWSDSIWGEDLPEGKYAPEYYSARGEDCPPILNVDLNEFLEDCRLQLWL